MLNIHADVDNVDAFAGFCADCGALTGYAGLCSPCMDKALAASDTITGFQPAVSSTPALHVVVRLMDGHKHEVLSVVRETAHYVTVRVMMAHNAVTLRFNRRTWLSTGTHEYMLVQHEAPSAQDDISDPAAPVKRTRTVRLRRDKRVSWQLYAVHNRADNAYLGTVGEQYGGGWYAIRMGGDSAEFSCMAFHAAVRFAAGMKAYRD